MRDARQPPFGVVLFAWSGAALFLASLLYFLYSYLVRFDVPSTTTRGSGTAIGLDVALFTGFAVHHSVAARASVKAWLQRVLPPMLERSVYTWTASALFIAVCSLWQAIAGQLYGLTGWAATAGYVVQCAGVVLTIRSSAKLDVLDLAGVRPVLDARRGHARVHVPLETQGLYGFVRHPLYFGWLLFVFGTPQMSMTRFIFAVVSSSYVAIAIPFEERSLIRTFGAEYRSYQQRVRWRLIPGLY